MSSSDLLPDLPNYDLEPADGMCVVERPVPGLTLKFILREHQSEKSLLDQIKPWPHTGTALGAVSWSPDGVLLASTANASIIYLWDIKTAKIIKKLEGHSEPLRSLAWSPDGKFLASGSYDKTIRIWDISQGKTVTILKEQTDLKTVLVHPDELRVQLQDSDPDWDFSNAEMMTAVGHLANHGYVTVLQGSQGAQCILLAPDLLANLASSVVLEARRNPRGLGVLDENRLLAGDYHFPELHNLDKEEREILLDAAAVLFLNHNLCFREIFNQQTFLVFPSLINEKRPKDENITSIEGASYQVKGAVENVYASLVVLLGYTNTFIRTNFETALVRVKSLLRDRGEAEKPTCFISYAWGVPYHERWVLQLAKDLRNADIDVLLDKWNSPPGSDLVRYIDQILKSEFVIVAGTPSLLQKYDSNISDPVVAAELRLINLRLSKTANIAVGSYRCWWTVNLVLHSLLYCKHW